MRSLLYIALAVCLTGYAFSVEEDADSPKERLVALYRTATSITVSTSTISTPLICYTEVKERDQALARGFLGVWRTRTVLSVSVTTSTSFFTCSIGTTATVACAGRRRRKKSVDMLKVETAELESEAPLLTGSMAEKAEQLASSERDSRLGFTVWTTSTSTLTVTTTSVNSATTVSVSYQCTIPGYNSLPLCG